ncbi:hypothetical protein M8494_10330 [Serratia ureilytica]
MVAAIKRVMSARSVARLTVAACTPGTAVKARSTRPTQEAQVMPSTGRLRRADEGWGKLAWMNSCYVLKGGWYQQG